MGGIVFPLSVHGFIYFSGALIYIMSMFMHGLIANKMGALVVK